MPDLSAPPGLWRRWWLATRPKTLAASVAPLLLGAGASLRCVPLDGASLALAWLALVALQITSNFANDLGDAQRGADGAGRLGPARATASGWVKAASMRRAVAVSSTVAVLLGALLVWREGVWVLAAGALGLLVALAYTLGPRPLAYLGLGDLSVWLALGPIAVGGSAALSGQAGLVPLVVGAWSGGALSAALLMVNNLRDASQDVAVGKRTLVVRFGPGVGRVVFVGWLLSVHVAVWAGATLSSARGSLLPLVLAPLSLHIGRRVWRERGAALNACLGLCALQLLLFALLFFLGEWLVGPSPGVGCVALFD